MASQSLPALLKACADLEEALEAERALAGGRLPESVLAQRAEAMAGFADAMKQFGAERENLDATEVGLLLESVTKLRAHTASAAHFESLRIKLAETIERLHRPAPVGAGYTNQGAKARPENVIPMKLDKVL